MLCSYRLSAWFRHGCSQAPECAHRAGLHGRHLLPRLNRSSSPKHRHRAHQRENRTTQRHRGWWQTGEYADQQRQWHFFPTPRVQYQAEGCHEFQRVYAVQSYLPHKHYPGCSPHSKDLARGQAPDPGARRHAAKGVRRLVGRRAAMLERGVHKNKANVATARELACWCWAIGCMVENG